MVKTHAWQRTYMRQRLARAYYSALKSKFDLGLDSSGQKPEEMLRLGEFKVRLFEIEFRREAPGTDLNALSKEATKLLQEFSAENERAGKTPEYQREFQPLTTEAFEVLPQIINA